MDKEEILKEIEKLLSFDGNETTINPNYLQYFSEEELLSIKTELERKYEKMVEENLEWTKSFKKSE